MRKIIVLFAILSLAQTTIAQKYTKMTKFEGDVLTGAVVDYPFEVTLRQGPETGVELMIDDRLVPYLICEKMPDGNVKLGMSKMPSVKWKGSAHPDPSSDAYVAAGNVAAKRGPNYRKSRAIITLSTLNSLTVDGMGVVKAEGWITSEECTVQLNSLAKLTGLKVEARSLTIDCGSLYPLTVETKVPDIKLRGKVANIKLQQYPTDPGLIKVRQYSSK